MKPMARRRVLHCAPDTPPDDEEGAGMAQTNREIEAARAFHAATSYVAVRDGAGDEQFMMGTPPDVEHPIWQEDWSLEPYAFKVYETLPPLAIPREIAPSALPALAALGRTGAEIAGEAVPDRATLAKIGRLAVWLLERQRTSQSGMTIEYRTAGGTGARYHLEVYFVCGALPDLEAGIYHYAAHDHSLHLLRAGDFRAALVAATGDEPAIAAAPVVLALTSTFWRNAWRYKARAYRHTYWDAGTTLANVLGVATSAGLPTRLVLGYADDAVNGLLGVDGTREATVALVALGRTASVAPPAPEIAPLDYPTRPISAREVEFPPITMLHAASGLTSGAEAAAWRAEPLRRAAPEPQGPIIPLQPLADEQIPAAAIEEIIAKRRSTRHYDTDVTIPFSSFSTLLDRSSRGIAADCLDPAAPPLHDTYLIVNGVEGLAPGVYLHHARRGAVELLREGNFRQQAQRLAVNQGYAADAHVNAYYLTDLEPVLARYGNRGYRLAQLECSLFAGKLHLGTHTLGLGAVGSTSFDGEVEEFFAPHAAGKRYMFITVFGKRRRTKA
jgi:SagB-type dehydrogenase family enzyme